MWVKYYLKLPEVYEKPSVMPICVLSLLDFHTEHDAMNRERSSVRLKQVPLLKIKLKTSPYKKAGVWINTSENKYKLKNKTWEHPV